jgi:uncharacterized metal-binding protein YceD (DUF177 family)
MQCVLVGLIDKLFVSKYCSTKPVFSEVVFGAHYLFLYLELMYHCQTVLPCVRCSTSFAYKMKVMNQEWGLEELHM